MKEKYTGSQDHPFYVRDKFFHHCEEDRVLCTADVFLLLPEDRVPDWKYEKNLIMCIDGYFFLYRVCY